MTLGITTNNQIRDINGYINSTLNGLPVSSLNQAFTLTVSTAKAVTVPASGADSYTAVITVTQGADVLMSPVGSPALTAPSGTVTSVNYQLINEKFVTTLLPNQAIQFIYANSNVADQTVTVHIAYYANVSNFN